MQSIIRLHVLACLLSLSLTTTVPSTRTKLNLVSLRNVTHSIDATDDSRRHTTSTYLEQAEKEARLKDQLRSIPDHRLAKWERIRARKLKEISTTTLPHPVNEGKKDETVSQSNVYESKIVQNRDVTSTTSENMKQLNGIDITSQNVQDENNTTAGITDRPMRRTSNQTTESSVRWGTRPANVLDSKAVPEDRSKNRPERNHSKKRYVSTPLNTPGTSQNKTTAGPLFKTTRRPMRGSSITTTESPIRSETQSANVLNKKAVSEGRSKNRPQRNHRKRKQRVSIKYRIPTFSGQKSKDKKRNSKESTKSLVNVTRINKASESEKETLLDKNNGLTKDDCPTCGKKGLSEENVRQIRLDMFIKTMAEKLRMSPNELLARQNKRKVPRFPRELLEATLQDNAMEKHTDTFHAKDQKVILPGRDLGRTCIAKRTSGCYSFNLAGHIRGDVASAHLWLYKTPDRNDTSVQTFLLYGLERLRSGKVLARNQIQRHDSYVREGWVVIDITKTVTSWVQERKSIEMIAIRCATCVTRNHKALYGTKHGYKPLVIIEYDKTSLQYRDRRSYDEACDPQFECCKRRLQVNFRDIHMHSVVAPPDLAVGYCYGTCIRITDYTYNHTRVKERVIYRSDDITGEMRERLQPCCVPVVLKSALLMITSSTVATTTELPNAIVDKCGCV